MTAILTTLVLTLGAASLHASVWYVQANGTGDGKTQANTTGTSAALDAVTKPGDVLLLLWSPAPFHGGKARLKGHAAVAKRQGEVRWSPSM